MSLRAPQVRGNLYFFNPSGHLPSRGGFYALSPKCSMEASKVPSPTRFLSIAGICRGDHWSSETKSARIHFDGWAMPAPTPHFSFLHRILTNAVLNGISVYINIKLCRFLLLCNRELSTLSTGFSTGRHRKTPCKQGVCSHSLRENPFLSTSCGKLFWFTEHC